MIQYIRAMENFTSIIEIAKHVQKYVAQQGKTLPISQGKMLKDEEMPEDLKLFLKTA